MQAEFGSCAAAGDSLGGRERTFKSWMMAVVQSMQQRVSDHEQLKSILFVLVIVTHAPGAYTSCYQQ